MISQLYEQLRSDGLIAGSKALVAASKGPAVTQQCELYQKDQSARMR